MVLVLLAVGHILLCLCTIASSTSSREATAGMDKRHRRGIGYSDSVSGSFLAKHLGVPWFVAW
jgi:hypothetical protein